MGLLFTLLLTYGGAILALFRPYYGFLIYVTFSILRPESLWHWSVSEGNYSRIVAVAFLIGWILNGCGDWRFGAARPAITSLILFWCWSAVGALTCEFPAVGFTFLVNMGKIILPTFVGLTMINSRRDIHLLVWTIAASIGYVAYDLNMAYFDGFNRLEFDGFGGMDNNSMTIALVTAVGFLFFLGLSESVIWRRYLAFAFAAFATHAVLFSFSRGGMLGLCVVGFASAVLIPKNRKNVALMSLGIVVGFAMAGPQVISRFESMVNTSVLGGNEQQADWSAESRIDLWKICLQMAVESPVVGKGPDHFPLLVHRYPVGLKEPFPQGKESHTTWLNTLAESGVPGLLLLLGYFLIVMKALWPYSRADTSDSQGLTSGSIARIVLASLAGYVVSAQFVTLEGLEQPYYIALVGVGLLKLESREEPTDSDDDDAFFDAQEEDEWFDVPEDLLHSPPIISGSSV